MQTLILLALFGLVAQLVDGSLGMAYGATSTTLLLLGGLNPATASASVHLAEIGTTLASGAAHWRFGNVDWRLVARLGVPGAAGAFLGATVLSNLSTEAARPLMSGILLAIGVYLLVRFANRPTVEVDDRRPLPSRFLAPLGAVAGFVDATGGGGWGPVSTPALLVTDRVEPRKVIGSVDTSEFIVSIAASVGFLLALGREGVAFATAGALLVGGLIAAPLAAWLVRKIPVRVLGASVGGLLIITNLRTVFSTAQVDLDVRTWGYALAAIVWAAAVVVAVRRHRLESAAAAEATAS
ncbi:MAG TPA: sulfite exporter TauE/SafE family protein [Egibacteraceae bacterium]